MGTHAQEWAEKWQSLHLGFHKKLFLPVLHNGTVSGSCSTLEQKMCVYSEHMRHRLTLRSDHQVSSLRQEDRQRSVQE